MKVLIVKKQDSCFPFVEEQMAALNQLGVDCETYLISGTGWHCYSHAMKGYWSMVKHYCPNVIHAHYGLSGLFANTQRHIPVITTYHGSDINNPRIRCLSKIAIRLSAYNIFVSQEMMSLSGANKNCMVLPCGINLKDFPCMEKKDARQIMGLPMNQKIILFSSDYHTPVKNPALAREAVNGISGAQLIELYGYSREQVSLLMHAADVCLMTSFTEGSPQFIKEAMACGCPIVTTPVGDTHRTIGNTKGCYFTSYEVQDCIGKLQLALGYASQYDRTNGRHRIKTMKLDNLQIARELLDIYNRMTF